MQRRHLNVVLIAALLGAGCTPVSAKASAPTGPPAVACPVTKPVPPGAIPPAAAQPIMAGYQGPPGGLHLSMYGNDALWVVIPRNGEVSGVWGPDGIDEKFPTVRLVEGRLAAQARRLDGPARPARVDIADGYGTIGFQAFGIGFPTAGCWKVTQRIAHRSLSFVVHVVRHTRGSATGRGG